MAPLLFLLGPLRFLLFSIGARRFSIGISSAFYIGGILEQVGRLLGIVLPSGCYLAVGVLSSRRDVV